MSGSESHNASLPGQIRAMVAKEPQPKKKRQQQIQPRCKWCSRANPYPMIRRPWVVTKGECDVLRIGELAIRAIQII